MLPYKRDFVSLLPLRHRDLGPQLSLRHRHRSVNSPSSHPCENLPPGGEPTCSGPLHSGVQAWPLGLPGTRFVGKNHSCTRRPETPEAAVMLMHESRTQSARQRLGGAVPGCHPRVLQVPKGNCAVEGRGPWRGVEEAEKKQYTAAQASSRHALGGRGTFEISLNSAI